MGEEQTGSDGSIESPKFVAAFWEAIQRYLRRSLVCAFMLRINDPEHRRHFRVLLDADRPNFYPDRIVSLDPALRFALANAPDFPDRFIGALVDFESEVQNHLAGTGNVQGDSTQSSAVSLATTLWEAIQVQLKRPLECAFMPGMDGPGHRRQFTALLDADLPDSIAGNITPLESALRFAQENSPDFPDRFIGALVDFESEVENELTKSGLLEDQSKGSPVQ